MAYSLYQAILSPINYDVRRLIYFDIQIITNIHDRLASYGCDIKDPISINRITKEQQDMYMYSCDRCNDTIVEFSGIIIYYIDEYSEYYHGSAAICDCCYPSFIDEMIYIKIRIKR